MPLILWLAACATGGADSDSAGGGDVADPEAPVVESAEVTCYLHSTGDVFTQWAGAATVSDPQGLSTIEPFGRVEISDAGGDIGVADLVCADGACTTSWKDDDFDVECDTVAVTTYDFAFIVTDQDGHDSAPRVVSGTKTTE